MSDGQKKYKNSIWVLILWSMPIWVFGQFPPAAGIEGSTAIEAKSDLIIDWATHCQVQRGWKNIMQIDSGYVSYGAASNAIGMADNEVVSLGDGGVAVVQFDFPVVNEEGADFVVFENGFGGSFLELAFVEVSSDGFHFFRFPATSLTPAGTQVGTFGQLDPTKINNLAGKYEGGYGTPFDLEELAGLDGLNINAITHIRLIDVVGSIDPSVGSEDAGGNMINDPFPTPFESGGFDLDAVGVLHEAFREDCIKVVPNPIRVGSLFTVLGGLKATTIRCYNLNGQAVNVLKKGNQLVIPDAPAGVYFLDLLIAGQRVFIKILITA